MQKCNAGSLYHWYLVIKNKLSCQDVWKGASLLNDSQNSGIGVCLYEVYVCEIACLLRFAGSI